MLYECGGVYAVIYCDSPICHTRPVWHRHHWISSEKAPEYGPWLWGFVWLRWGAKDRVEGWRVRILMVN